MRNTANAATRAAMLNLALKTPVANNAALDFYASAHADDRERTVLNRARGRSAQRSGDTLEQAVAFAHAEYRKAKTAVISKLHPKTRGNPQRTAHGGTGLVIAGRGDCDYLGWVRSALGLPVPVAFDLKSTSDASFALPSDPKNARTLLNQIDYLCDFGSLQRTLAFLLVVDRSIGYGWFLLPPVLQRIKAGERVPLRSKLRDKSAAITHHQPAFALSSVRQLAQGHPLVDWRTGLIEHGLL